MKNLTNRMNFESLENRRMMAADMVASGISANAADDVTFEQVLATKSPTESDMLLGGYDHGTLIVCDFNGNGESTDSADPMNETGTGRDMAATRTLDELRVFEAAFASR